MNHWTDIACIVFVAVTMNHLGLIGEIEHLCGRRIRIVDCPKCAAFWATLLYGLWCRSLGEFIPVLAVSFLASYSAIWLELIEGMIDKLNEIIYDKIYPTED